MPKLKIEDLTKRSVWAITEAELNAMLIDAKKRDTFAEDEAHYMNILRPVFDLQYLDRADAKRVEQLERERYDIFSIPTEGPYNALAIRKRTIKKVTDLTLENISHLQASEVLRLIDKNLGTGWQGLPLATQDIIQTAFYVDCSVLPSSTLHRKGGLLAKRKADGYEILEIQRGTWTEAIFIKPKPIPVKGPSAREQSPEDDNEDAKLSKLLKALGKGGADDDLDDDGDDTLDDQTPADEENLEEDETLVDDEALEPGDEPEFVNLDDVGDDFEEEDD